jgi:hypothetical protein
VKLHGKSRLTVAAAGVAACLLVGSVLVFKCTQTPGEPRSPAELAVRDCDQTPAAKSACYESFLLRRLPIAGVEATLETLREIGALDRSVAREGHVFAHAIGVAAYRAKADVHEAFARCSELYQSGCYHGVIQAYFEDMQTGRTGRGLESGQSSREAWSGDVNHLCDPYREEGKSRWLLFQCVHGIGHGLTALYDHDLPRALRDCDLLASDWDRESCYGGAFMENIVNATSHRSAAASRRQGTMAAHAGTPGEPQGPGVAPKPRFKPLDPRDPLYPCSILEAKYLVACYQMQTSVILFHNGGNFGAAARVCDRAPVALRAVCYQSLGRDVSAYTLQDHAQSIRLCSLGDPRYRSWCFAGLVKNFVDLTASADEGFAFCPSVPEVPDKLKCYEALGEQIAALESETEEREALCGRAEKGYRKACRYGARITLVRPTGMAVPR